MIQEQTITISNGRQVLLVVSEDLKAFLLMFKGRIIASEFSINEGQRYPCSLPDNTQLFVVRSGNRFDVESARPSVPSGQASTQQQVSTPEGGHGHQRPGNHAVTPQQQAGTPEGGHGQQRSGGHAVPSNQTNTRGVPSAANDRRKEPLIIWCVLMFAITFVWTLWLGATGYYATSGNYDKVTYIISMILVAISCVSYGIGLFFSLFNKVLVGISVCVVSLICGLVMLSNLHVHFQFILVSVLIQFILFTIFILVYIVASMR